jgi:hypothetical protein
MRECLGLAAGTELLRKCQRLFVVVLGEYSVLDGARKEQDVIVGWRNADGDDRLILAGQP